jgi:hypothetical protein
MNHDEQFEQRLQRRPLREVPSAWREEILNAARTSAASRHSSLVTCHSSWWRELFWPHPTAWAALAGVWLVILGAQFVTREPSPQDFARRAPPSRQMRELLKQQEQLFAELVGPIEKPEADAPKPLLRQPRSQRRDEFLNA